MRLHYRVTHHVVQTLPLTSKQKFCFGLARLGQARPKRNFLFLIQREVLDNMMCHPVVSQVTDMAVVYNFDAKLKDALVNLICTKSVIEHPRTTDDDGDVVDLEANDDELFLTTTKIAVGQQNGSEESDGGSGDQQKGKLGTINIMK